MHDEDRDRGGRFEDGRLVEAVLDTLYAAAPIGLCFLDPEFRYISVNETLARMSNLPVDSYYGRRVSEVLPPGIAGPKEALLRRVLATGRPVVDAELTVSVPSDPEATRHYEVSFLPVTGQDGQTLGINGLVKDVTARKRAERAAATASQRLSFALQVAQAAIWEIDLISGRRHWPPEFYTLLGVPAAMPPGADALLSVVHPEDREIWPAALRQALAARREEFRIDLRVHHPERGLRWLNIRSRIFYGADGQAERLIGFSVDITELVETRSALRRAQEAVHALVDASPGPLATLKQDCGGGLVFDWANPPFAELIGRPVAALRGRPFAQALGMPEDNPAGGMPGRLEVTLAGGEAGREIQLLFTTVQGAPNELGTVLASAVDLTARRAAARKEAEQHLLEALGRMAGRVAHEINNILQPIMSHATLARHVCGEGHPANEHIDAVQDGVRNGRAIITSVLRLAGGKAALRRPTALEDEAASVLALVRPTVPSGVILETVLQPTGGQVAVAPGELFQIVSNLLVNAVDANRGLGWVRVAVSPCLLGGAEAGPLALAPGRYAELVMADGGQGMDAATLTQATDPFFTTKPVGKGVGLGLPTVQALVDSLGGGMTITSAPGQGTSVRVLLPFVSAAEGAAV